MTIKKLPNVVYIYICDYDGEEPIYAVALTLAEIPSEHHGEVVGTYERQRTNIWGLE